jgi:hypothetical protein
MVVYNVSGGGWVSMINNCKKSRSKRRKCSVNLETGVRDCRGLGWRSQKLFTALAGEFGVEPERKRHRRGLSPLYKKKERAKQKTIEISQN